MLGRNDRNRSLTKSFSDTYGRILTFMNYHKKVAGFIGVAGLFLAPVAAAMAAEQRGDQGRSHTPASYSNGSSHTDAGSELSATPDTENNVDINVRSQSSSNEESRHSVTINGQKVEVPQEGASRRVVNNEAGNSSVEVYIENHSTSSAKNRSSVNIESFSNGSSDTESSQDESENIEERHRRR